jgi:hypothetical protein
MKFPESAALCSEFLRVHAIRYEGRILNRASRGLVADSGCCVVRRECVARCGTSTAPVATPTCEVGASRSILRGLRHSGRGNPSAVVVSGSLVGLAADAAVLVRSAQSQGWIAVTHDSDAVGRAGLRCGTDLNL